MIKNLRISIKLIGAFLIIAVFSVFASLVSIASQHIHTQYDLVVEEGSAHIEALLEMKSVANEVDKQALASQFLGSTFSETVVAERKNELLAQLDKLDKWKNQYIQNSDQNDTGGAKLIESVTDAKNIIIDTSLAYFTLREKGVFGAEVQKKRTGIK